MVKLTSKVIEMRSEEMTELAHRVDKLINKILLTAENQHELLIGHCQSEVKLTNTQEHILMLVAKEQLTNSDLARELNVSQAAVTKAVKALLAAGLLSATKDETDGRVTFLTLTDEALPIAQEHAHHHDHTLEVYGTLLSGFSSEEQAVIERFLDDLSQGLDGGK